MPSHVYECRICHLTFGEEKRLATHQSRQHYICPNCPSGSASFASRKHMVVHWLATQHQYYCTACAGGLETMGGLLDHNCRPAWKCPVCSMVAPDHETYAQHWRDTKQDPRHDGPNSFDSSTTCQDSRCMLNFKSKDLLTSHLRQHNGCQTCHLHFQNDNNLRMVGWL